MLDWAVVPEDQQLGCVMQCTHNTLKHLVNLLQVSVRFETISGTAVIGKDFSISSDKVTLGDGETRVPVPVAIINNLVPQLEHFFTIQLLNETTGGARLGLVTQTVVTIEDYDYPHGIFGMRNGIEGFLAIPESRSFTLLCPLTTINQSIIYYTLHGFIT